MLSFLTVNLDGSLDYLFGTLGDGNANWLLLLPQGWSIGVEHMVYAVCPVILWSASRTLAFVVASLLLRISLADAGDLWQGWFFPSALCLFLAGAMAYQFGECLKAHDRLHLLQHTTGSAALPAFLIVALFSGSGQFGGMLPFGVKEAYLLIIPVLYTLFEWSKSSRIDRAIGQLSYPIFVFHWVVILCLNQFFAISADMRGATIMVATILVSIFLAIYIEKPIDDFDHRCFRRLHLAET